MKFSLRLRSSRIYGAAVVTTVCSSDARSVETARPIMMTQKRQPRSKSCDSESLADVAFSVIVVVKVVAGIASSVDVDDIFKLEFPSRRASVCIRCAA